MHREGEPQDIWRLFQESFALTQKILKYHNVGRARMGEERKARPQRDKAQLSRGIFAVLRAARAAATDANGVSVLVVSLRSEF